MHALKFTLVRTCLRLFSVGAAGCAAAAGSGDAAGSVSTGSALSSASGGVVSSRAGSPPASSAARFQIVEEPHLLQERTIPSLTMYTSDSKSLCSTISRALQLLHWSSTRLASFSESVMLGKSTPQRSTSAPRKATP